MGLRSWIERKRHGGQTGLNEMSNNAKMTGVIAGPFLVAWFLVELFFPKEYVDIGILVVFAGWGAYCVLIYSGAKADANNYRAFPQPVYRFPDGGTRTFNKLLVAPDSFKKKCTFKDGGIGYEYNHEEDKLEYHQDGFPFPFVWTTDLWKLPAEVDKSFAFSSEGEFFHRGIAVNHPASESVSVYVVGWDIKEGKVRPICLINDCAFNYEEMMKNSKKISKADLKKLEEAEMLIRAGKKREMSILQHSAYLEDALETTMKEGSKKWKKVVDDGFKAIRGRVHTIMDTDEPFIQRYFTFRNLFKAVLIVTAILVISHFFFGWP